MFLFDFMFTVVPILILLIFVLTILLIFSPKLRAKLLGTQIKATKYMLDENKENLTDIATTMGEIGVDTTSNIIGNNKEKLTNVASDIADISKEGIETTVRAIRKGITEDNIYCKYCGKSIDADSIFCKSCGKEQ